MHDGMPHDLIQGQGHAVSCDLLKRIPRWLLRGVDRQRQSRTFFGPGRVPKRYDGCSCCYPFRKTPKALLISKRKLRNFAYTFVTSFPTDLPS